MGGPKYQRAMDVIKAKIASGEVSGEITLGRIQELAGATDSTARRTAKELVDEGILESHPGAPYAVLAAPEDVAAGQSDGRSPKVQLAELRRQVAELRSEVPPGLSETLERIEASLENLYDKLGYDMAPDGDGERGEDSIPAAGRGHTG